MTSSYQKQQEKEENRNHKNEFQTIQWEKLWSLFELRGETKATIRELKCLKPNTQITKKQRFVDRQSLWLRVEVHENVLHPWKLQQNLIWTKLMGENSVKHVLWILCVVILAADNCFCFDFSVFAVLPSLQLNLFVNELVFSKTISLSSFLSFSLTYACFQFQQQDLYQSLYRFYENCFVLCFECLKIYLTNFSFVWYHNNCIYSSISSPHSNQTKWVTTVLQTSLNTFPMLKLRKSKPQQKHFYVFPVIYTKHLWIRIK